MPYADPEKRRANNKAYYAENRVNLGAHNTAYREANRETLRAHAKAYREANQKEISAREKARRAANSEKISAQRKARREANREKIRFQKAAHKRRRLARDPEFKLLENLRRRVNHAVNRETKSAGTRALIGCTIPELRAHLELQFRPGMTWDNYGPVWHVDHKKPCASFDLLDPAQQRACFHYSNLQPLFAQENLRKGDKYEQLSQ